MRLLTRSDFDGLACAVLLKELGMITDMKFVHVPRICRMDWLTLLPEDILANVPYVPGCGIWFDHHTSEVERGSLSLQFNGASHPAPSCARVIFDFYGGAAKFGARL